MLMNAIVQHSIQPRIGWISLSCILIEYLLIRLFPLTGNKISLEAMHDLPLSQISFRCFCQRSRTPMQEKKSFLIRFQGWVYQIPQCCMILMWRLAHHLFPQPLLWLCLVPLKSSVAVRKNTVAHYSTFRLFVVDIVLP